MRGSTTASLLAVEITTMSPGASAAWLSKSARTPSGGRPGSRRPRSWEPRAVEAALDVGPCLADEAVADHVDAQLLGGPSLGRRRRERRARHERDRRERHRRQQQRPAGAPPGLRPSRTVPISYRHLRPSVVPRSPTGHLMAACHHRPSASPAHPSDPWGPPRAPAALVPVSRVRPIRFPADQRNGSAVADSMAATMCGAARPGPPPARAARLR